MKNTRNEILDKTIELLWHKSYGSVSVDDICAAARIHKGSFYHYFPSKIDVVLEAFEKHWQDNKQFFDAIFSSSLSPLERLDKYSEAVYQKQKERADIYGQVIGCPYVTCGSELSTTEERIRSKMTEIFLRSASYFEKLLEDANDKGLASCDSYITAQKMLSYVAGVMYQAKLKNDVEVIKRDLKSGLLRYLNIEHINAEEYKIKESVNA